MESNDKQHDDEIDLGTSGIDLDGAEGLLDGGRTDEIGNIECAKGASAQSIKADVDVRPPTDLTGLNLDGLLIKHKIGEGGMGEVWLAHDEDLDIPVAIKVLPAALANDQHFVMRFMREARAIAKLEHSNIVGVKQAGRREVGGQLLRLMVMEYVEGVDAHAALKAAPDRRLEAQRAAEIALAAARALKYAHSKGVIHRDVKPSNILISSDGLSIKLLDFGLAKLQRKSDTKTVVRVTDTGEGEQQPATSGETRSTTLTILGTPSYMPPEQCEGKAADGRADIYSLGITLYELLTGKLPFEGDTVFSIIEGHVRTPLEFPPSMATEVPASLRELITGMCEKKPDDRLSLAVVIEKLEEYLGVSSGGRTPPSAITTKKRKADEGVRPPISSRTNLIRRETSFVGRESEIGTLGQLLEDARLVTVVGPGGVGKTRLTQEYGLAEAATSDYPGGIWFCDLTEARSVDGICFAVSQGIGIALTQSDSVEQIEALLAMREKCLMIFDNFEQVVDLAAETLGRWMAKAPNVKFITSSREPLHLEGEKSFPLSPLSGAPLSGSAGDAGRSESAVEGSSSWERGRPRPSQTGLAEGGRPEKALPEDLPPAVQLFVDRASSVKRGFTLDDSNREAVTQIVDQLDGIPLAIELAASRCSALSPQKLLERLPRRFDLLKGRRKDASARQATLRGAIDWSWNLLNDYEKSALTQCSVFQGGFFLEAAEEVIDLSAFDDAPFEMDAVEALVEKSLLVGYEVRSLPGEIRYRMLESIRQYAGEKLGEMEIDVDALLLRHAEHYVSYAEEWDEKTCTRDGVEALDRLELELENLIGIQESLEDSQPELAVRSILACADLLKTRGPWKERVPRLTRAVDVAENLDKRDLLVHALYALIQALTNHGTYAEILAIADRLAELTSQIREKDYQARELRLMAVHSRYFAESKNGDYLAAASALDLELEHQGIPIHGALDVLQQTPPKFQRIVATCIQNRGSIYANQGDSDLALECYEEVERIARSNEDLRILAMVLNSQQLTYRELADLDRAMALSQESERYNREIGNLRGIAINVGNRGVIHHMRQEYETELECYLEAERLNRHCGYTSGVTINIGNRGITLLALERVEEAILELHRAEELSRATQELYSLAHWTRGIAEGLLRLEKDLKEALRLAHESLEIRANMGMTNTSLYFSSLSTLAAVEHKLGLSDVALEHAVEAKALGESIDLPRIDEHGPTAGKPSAFWQWIDEILESSA